MRRIRKYLDEKAAQTLMHALIIGRMNYCDGILYGLYQQGNLQSSNAIRICGPWMCHIIPVLRKLHWLPVQFRIQFKLIIITFKVTNGQGSIYLQELIRLDH